VGPPPASVSPLAASAEPCVIVTSGNRMGASERHSPIGGLRCDWYPRGESEKELGVAPEPAETSPRRVRVRESVRE